MRYHNPPMTYRETLPEGCPPDEADEITAPRIVFRLVWTDPPTDDDFRSQRALKPDRVFRNVSECMARGVSVYLDPSDLKDLMQKFPHMRGTMVCQVELDRGAGFIQRTRGSHHTWWPLAEFDILANSTVQP